MNEEDVEMLRNEEDAEPRRFSSWVNAQGEFQRNVEPGRTVDALFESPPSGRPLPTAGANAPPHATETEEVASRRSSLASSSSSASSSSTTHTPRLEEIRTHNVSSTRERRDTFSSVGGGSGILYRHPTERNPEALSRIETIRSQHAGTVGARLTGPSRITRTLSRRRTEKPLSEMGANKPYPPPLPDREEYVVEFMGVDDPMHAQNWPMKKKIYIAVLMAYLSLAVTMGSSIFSPSTRPVAEEFGVIPEVTTLGTSLFVFGYAFGPLVWAPMSELYGRKLPLLVGSFGFSVFSLAVATGKDLQTVLICRFFAGLFGACPLSVVAAVYADIFSNVQRGIAIGTFSATVFMGPMMAPFIGGFIVTSHLGWRWTMYISSIMGWLAFALIVLFMEETYPPQILVGKAAKLRRRTLNWGIHAKQEEIEVDLKELIIRNVSRPLRILFTEPIVLLITIYMSFVYGILYCFLTAYTLVFEGQYGFTPGVSGLTYFGLIVGVILGFALMAAMNPSYGRKLKANNNIPVPEWRLPLAMVGAPTFAGGLFWFGWTGYNGRTLWVAPVFSGIFTGFGIWTIFLALLNYIIDAYLMFAASAVAGNTFMRSLFAGTFPLFSTYMLNGMGIQWASTLLGCVATLMVPMPFLFYIYGKKIRAKSTFSPAPDIAQDKRRDEEARLGTDGGNGSGSENTAQGSDLGPAVEKEESEGGQVQNRDLNTHRKRKERGVRRQGETVGMGREEA
ncbi:MFS general substrate transporter [Paraphaeosphaeria sporulosa]|uniref:MFS general substrate transporter n=1 Tax=Paraphaeosphaeria sporulosa TaxID=1460663 RepID=A0A177CXX4_9PLEO|nr:MFS general substrate transporter [Paraphaeosphaeria sporulosa]OAG11677.1 MFS general substrate transporter [Paraphaeosphaeria sporulosa]